jgi:type IV pilus assembly protein PilM
MDVKNIFNKNKIQKIIDNIDFSQILTKLNSLRFSREIFANMISPKIVSVLVISITDKLTILSIDIKDEIRLDALETYELVKERKNEDIVRYIRDFIQEKRIEHKNAIISLTLDSLLIKRIQLPELPETELPEAIKWQIKEELSFDFSDIVIDFSIIKKTIKKDGSKVLDIMCVAAQEQEVEHHVLLLKKVGLNCLAVGVEVFGYAKNVEKYLKQERNESIGILHLGKNICYLAIYKNNKLEFYRELPISIIKLKNSLKGMLVSDTDKVEVLDDEINDVLFKIGIPDKYFIYREKIDSSQILSILRPILEHLIIEIKRSLSYYDSEFNGGTVNRIFVVGSALKIPNIDKFLAKQLNSNVEKFSLRDKLIVSSRIDQESLSENYAVLGLALDYRKNFNLLPFKFRTEKIERLEIISLRWIAFIAFLLLIIFYVFAKVGISAYQKRLDNALLHLDVLSEIKEIKTRSEQLNNFIVNIKNSQPHIGTILKKLSNITPKEIFFNKFSLNVNTKTGEIFGVVKTKRENSNTILTKLVRDMEKSYYFTDVSISSVKKNTKEIFEIIDFKITFNLP